MFGVTAYGMEMVFSFFRQLICLRAAIMAAQIFGLSAGDAERQVIADGRPSPQCKPGFPILGAYVDNILAVCWDGRGALLMERAIVAVLTSFGLRSRVELSNSATCVFIGLWPDLEKRLLRNTEHRVWRLHAALILVVKQGRASGAAMRILLGHMVHATGVFRAALSILHACYVFVSYDEDDVVRDLPSDVVDELRVFVALLRAFHSDLGRETHTTVLMSDASLKGYAVHDACLSSDECVVLGGVQERWRFKPQ